MKPTTFSKAFSLGGLTLVTLSTLALGQGELAPTSTPTHKSGPGAALTAGGLPQPTMKTLQQVEPRTDVLTLSADASSRYVIDKPGSYYLSSNLMVREDIAISVRSSDVTLDLNGFQVTHAERGGSTGINVQAGLERVSVRNGSVSNFSTGVDAFGIFSNKTKGCLLEDLKVSGCAGNGIVIGDAGTVRNCTSADNGGHGIFADNGSIIANCVAFGNGGNTGSPGAIWVRNGCTVSNCVARENTTDGIVTGSGCTVSQCAATENTGTYGINAGTSNTLKQCTANNNVGAGEFSRGLSVGDGSTVIGCTANNNDSTNAGTSSAQGVGIFAASRCTVTDCTTTGNKGDGIRCSSDSRIEKNTCIDSGIYGAGIRATGDNNRIDGNHSTRNRYGIRYEGTSNLVIRNSAHGNGLAIESGNFSGDGAANAVGAFIYMNDINDESDDKPWGNFTKTPQIVGGR